MNEYRKIPNIFEFDNKRNIIGLAEPFNTLKEIMWIGTEKIDGTNIRVMWDGYNLTFAGRTDAAQIPLHLLEKLKDLFNEDVIEQIFKERNVIFYGEGYGAKIQKDGGKYSSDAEFICFDIKINGECVDRSTLTNICSQLNINFSQRVFFGTLVEAIDYVRAHHVSCLNALHEMEGIVLEPSIGIYDKNGELLKCKCKWRDLKNENL